MLFSSMHPSWQRALSGSQTLLDTIEQQIAFDEETTPPQHLVMRAFEPALDQTKVLLIGQDPYPTKSVACGLAFAVSPETKKPQSLRNLMKELSTDIPSASSGGDLSRWANQGVLLLNSALTTRVGQPGSHTKLWSEFTLQVIQELDRQLDGKLVCLSLGEHAKKLSKAVILGDVIQATHPSPLSATRGFFGSRIYSRINSLLDSKSVAPIDWSC